MKCPTCTKGIMEKKKDIIEEDGVTFEAFACSACGEEIMNMKQLKVLAGKYRKLRKAKEITFAKWGNSMAVRIPNDIVEEYHLSVGKQGILTKDKEGIKIIPN
jgi:DNA-directed RNA polymerase subunit M/transcription elongation factor TFIIS